jgi:hypothetical protein
MLLYEKKNSLAVAFNSTFRYINVLSINNDRFHIYVDSIYPNELEIKDTINCSKSVSYLDILLKLDINGNLTTQLYDKLSIFPSSTFFTCVAIFKLHLNVVFISRS